MTRTPLTWLTLLLTVLWFIGGRWYYVCQIRHICGDEIPVATAAAPERTLALKEGAQDILKDYEQFSFPAGAFTANLNANNNEFLDKAADYLKNNPGKKLTITGYYLASEKGASSGIYENLGLARAAAMRELLKQRGIAEDRISLDSEMTEGDALKAPLSFNVYQPSVAATDKKEVAPLEKQQFTFTNMSFSDANFDYNSDEFKPGPQFKLYADSVKTFLKLNPAKALTVTGYTDAKGTPDYNVKLGKRRAEAVERYFKQLGVNAKINTASKGQLDPVADNNTEQGRHKNRRVNVKIE